MLIFSLVVALLALDSAALGASISGQRHRVRTVATFPADIDPENLVVRHSGQILMTASNQNKLYQIDPWGRTKPIVLHTFDGHMSVTGIDEVEKDVFVATVGNFSFATFTSTPQSFGLWKIDLRGTKPCVGKLFAIPELDVPNGLVYVGDNDILIADSHVGGIFRVNVHSGHPKLVDSNDPLMKSLPPDPSNPDLVGFGINGIHLNPLNKHEIIFSSTDQNVIGKVGINQHFVPIGNATKVADAVNDDLIPAPNGDIHVASNNAITTIYPGGSKSVFNFTTDAVRLTALKYGRTDPYKHSLFGTVIVFGETGTNTGKLIVVDNY
ncbi:hypothetical protein FA10DRAFT_269851 [Acaromyces ingoldii]|uniref:NHL repeat-containing protein n=1 Tax=Acaromyces ingoldii TaxID=215250 RepID=A0A316YD19_9BASI|nr:hypothetical protein FA10DRAFT_269851 [Acaromyces ingoldii]PWN86744.1 hypothetical protein FA10DRAFT_269851 [Acaromyces ingoldii]